MDLFLSDVIDLSVSNKGLRETIACFLEAPVNGINFNSNLRIRGWAVDRSSPHSPLTIRLELGGRTLDYITSEERLDVAEALGITNQYPHFGFDISIPFSTDPMVIKLVINGLEHPIYKVISKRKRPPLIGKKGWLFLDVKKEKLDFFGKNRRALFSFWDRYFAELKDTLSPHLNSVTFLIAPSKERVFSDYISVKTSDLNIADYLLDRYKEVVFPLRLLSPQREMTYTRGDTHWSDFGAALVGASLLERLGFSQEQCEKIFDSEYLLKQEVGDLSDKIFPVMPERIYVANLNKYKEHITFENTAENFGKIVILENINSVSGEKCLVFGSSSSSRNLIYFLSIFFSRVVFVHSSGRVDKDIFAHEKANHVILQINQRFLISPGSFQISISSVLRDLYEQGYKREFVSNGSEKNKFYENLTNSSTFGV